MAHVVSPDGTRIAYERSGDGPPLVLVHGTAIDRTQWSDVAPQLGDHFTVCAIDRRGRGDSGDAASYAIEREFDDVAAVVDSIPGAVNLLGHSYGAVCSLEAALRSPDIRKVALYEPPIRTGNAPSYPAETVHRIQTILEAGEAERALVLAYEAAEMPTAELDLLRSLPTWRARVAAAPTLLREFDAAKAYAFDPRRFRRLETPFLLLVGSESAPVYRSAVAALDAALLNSRTVVLPGQGHEGIETAPDLFLREVIGFFLDAQPTSGPRA